VPGDAWSRREGRKLEAQVAVMNVAVARLVASTQPLTLFGDNLFVDLDLSAANLPTGSRLRLGGAIVEVTPKPHNGCAKFRARFGDDALALVWKPELRHLNLRGLYVRVLEPGAVAPGDPFTLLSRASPRDASAAREPRP
jgi:MOSC domain-containing protein YiiM